MQVKISTHAVNAISAKINIFALRIKYIAKIINAKNILHRIHVCMCLCVYACVNMFDTRTLICECFKAPVVHYLEFLRVTWCLPK